MRPLELSYIMFNLNWHKISNFMGFKNLVSNYRSQFEPVKIVAFPETIHFDITRNLPKNTRPRSLLDRHNFSCEKGD